MKIDTSTLNSSSCSQQALHALHRFRQQVPVVGSRSFVHESTSRVATMTSRPTGAMICLRPVSGRNAEQWRPRDRQRHRQPRSASITSTLMMTSVLILITCDTGQPRLSLCTASVARIKIVLGHKFGFSDDISTK